MMETIKISDADAHHKELMAGIAGIERALLLINGALRLRVVEVGSANTQMEQEKVAAMKWQRKARRQDLAQALHGHGMTDTALRMRHVPGTKFKIGDRVKLISELQGSFLGLGTVKGFVEGEIVRVAFDSGQEMRINERDLELIGDAP